MHLKNKKTFNLSIITRTTAEYAYSYESQNINELGLTISRLSKKQQSNGSNKTEKKYFAYENSYITDFFGSIRKSVKHKGRNKQTTREQSTHRLNLKEMFFYLITGGSQHGLHQLNSNNWPHSLVSLLVPFLCLS